MRSVLSGRSGSAGPGRSRTGSLDVATPKGKYFDELSDDVSTTAGVSPVGTSQRPYLYSEAEESLATSRDTDMRMVEELVIPSLGNSRRQSAIDSAVGHRLDPEFEAMCRATVAAERGAMVAATLGNPKSLGRREGETFFASSPERLKNFFAGDGAVYSQYDLSRASFSGGPLPDGWKAVRSRSTGRMYYANAETGECQWDPPLYPLDRNWDVAVSHQTGSVFYVHKGTGKWQWERPVDEQFTGLRESGNTDLEALETWQKRNAKADGAYAGLDTLRALPAPSSPKLPALPPPSELCALPAPA